MKQSLAIHFQFMNDNGKIMEKLLNSKKPFEASIVPNLLDSAMKTPEDKNIYERIHSAKNYYPGWAIKSFKENKNNPNITWVQEGYRHCCNQCFENYQEKGGRENKNAWPDPFHEHICLDGHSQSLKEQIEVIEKGKNLITKTLGINVVAYCPPNHLYNEDTLQAVQKLGFDYFLTRNGFDYFARGWISLPSYKDKRLVIVPESKPGTKSPIILTYYDHLAKNWEDFSKILDSSVPLSELPISKKPKNIIKFNEKIIILYKKVRDFSKKIKKTN